MKLSIIVPFYKYRQYLEDCLASLKDSQLEDFETILVLDHVEEEIQDLIDGYKESLRLKVVEVKGAEPGVSVARNAGLAAAEGEYVYFLDSDDYLYEDTLQILLDKEKETGADVVYGRKRYTWFSRKVYLGVTEERRNLDDANEMKDDGGEADVEADDDTVQLSDYEMAMHKLLRTRRGMRNISSSYADSQRILVGKKDYIPRTVLSLCRYVLCSGIVKIYEKLCLLSNGFLY